MQAMMYAFLLADVRNALTRYPHTLTRNRMLLVGAWKGETTDSPSKWDNNLCSGCGDAALVIASVMSVRQFLVVD